MSRWAQAGAVIGLALLVGCGEQFTRDDAVAVLELSGVSSAEATCMADTLLVLDRLDAADPSYELGDDDREALRAAQGRCESGEQFEIGGGAEAVSEIVPEFDESAPLGAETAVLGATVVESPEELGALAADARARLVSLGRSEQFAECVVERLVAIEAYEVLEDRFLGLGASPLEADAFAGCA